MGTQLAFDWRQIIHSRKNIALLGLFFAAFIIAFFALVWTHRLDIQQTSEATANAAVANYAEYNLDTLSKTQKPLLANLDDQNWRLVLLTWASSLINPIRPVTGCLVCALLNLKCGNGIIKHLTPCRCRRCTNLKVTF